MSLSLNQKLLAIQKEVDKLTKDTTVGEGKSAYKAVGSEQVLETIRPKMNELGLLLIPSVNSANVIVGSTSSGTQRFLTEINMTFTWLDVESNEKMEVGWYAQGVDLAGEKGVGKAQTYAEKYFLLKFFHIPTPKDDPDSDPRTKTGEKLQKDTQAEKETEILHRNSITQMLWELYGKDKPEKHKEAMIFLTKSQDGKFLGVETVEALKSNAQLALVYAKLKKSYETRMKKPFEYDPKQFEPKVNE